MQTSAWSIRVMLETDIPAALALWRATEGVGLSAADSPECLAAFLARNPGASAVAVDAGGSLVGTVLCGDDGRRGFLYHLAVAPALRRTGAGRALVDHALGHLRSRGLEKCNILVYANNAEGLAFWRRLGWSGRDDLALLQIPVARLPACSGGC